MAKANTLMKLLKVNVKDKNLCKFLDTIDVRIGG